MRTVGRYDECRGAVQVFVEHYLAKGNDSAAVWCTGSGLETHLR